MEWGAIGATLLGVGAGWGLSELSEWKRRRRDITSKRRAFASALLCEVEAFRDYYKERIGNEIEQDVGNFVKKYIPGQESYFVIFDSNGDSLGLINPQDARKIVAFYIAAKGQLDILRTLHNEFESFGPDPIPWDKYNDQLAKVRQVNQRLLKEADSVINCLKEIAKSSG